MSNKKLIATAPSGTTYTQINDSTYDWRGKTNGYGTIHLNPKTGAYGTYVRYEGASIPPTEHRLSEEYLNKHINNINSLQGQFKPEPGLLDLIKSLVRKVTSKENGGNLTEQLQIAYRKSGGLIQKYQS